MTLVLFSLALLLLSGVGAALCGRRPEHASAFAAGGSVLAGLAGVISCGRVLSGGERSTWSVPWGYPYGELSLNLDPLSAFFLLPIFILGPLAAIYGAEYMRHYGRQRTGPAWLSFQLLFFSMALVVLASNAVLFLVAWEITVLSSFLLVVFEHEKPGNLRAGWLYLAASHLGTAFLLVLFLILSKEAGSTDFGSALHSDLGTSRGVVFLLALVGFGAKAGFAPFHVWLPEAHPAAPSNVSALMSGVMIKTGIYGLVRVLFILGQPAVWWGWTLLAVGLSSGVIGVLFALSQHNLKRLLAYHSVENIGIITLGLGLGCLGLSASNGVVAALALSGALLHVLNHAVFKGLLFLGAGAVLQQSKTASIDCMGGLFKRMPWTGSTFLVGCMSISGLPPFNGFISEFLIYFAAFAGVVGGGSALLAPGVLVIVGLALIGGLAAACFAKAFSVVFLGIARSPEAGQAKEVGLLMRIPMAVLAALCALIAFFTPFGLGVFTTVLTVHAGYRETLDTRSAFQQVFFPLLAVTLSAVILVLLAMLLLRLRSRLLNTRDIGRTVTWDCGYSAPSASMQYTGSSFAQPLTLLFSPILQTKAHLDGVSGYFPTTARFQSHTGDVFMERFFQPLFGGVRRLLKKLTLIQHGVVQLYVLYVAVTLAALLVWGLT